MDRLPFSDFGRNVRRDTSFEEDRQKRFSKIPFSRAHRLNPHAVLLMEDIDQATPSLRL